MKYALDHGFAPLAFAAPRYAIAGLAMCVLVACREGSLRVPRGDLRLVVFAAVAGVLANQLALVFALDAAAVSTVALLFGTAPIFIALFAQAAGIERVGTAVWAAIALSVAGVGLVIAGAPTTLTPSALGIALGMINAVTWAIFAVAVGPLMRRSPPLRLNAIITAIGALPLLACGLPSIAAQDWGAVTAGAWTAFAFSTLGACVLAPVAWFRAIDRVGASRAAVYANLEPFLAALLAVLVLGDRLSGWQVLGGSVLALGIVVVHGHVRRRSVA